MSFTLLSAVILGIITILIYGQVMKGYRQGATQSFINLSILIVCAFFGALVSVILSGLLCPPIEKFVMSTEIYESIEVFAGNMSIVAHFFIKVILALVLYIPMFFALHIVCSLIVRKILKKSKKKYSQSDAVYFSEGERFYSKNDKKIGAFLGIVSGFVLSVVIFTPFVGLLRASGELVSLVGCFPDNQLVNQSEEFKLVDKYSNDFSVCLIDACGGGAICDIATRITIDGEATSLNRELRVLKKINLGEKMPRFDRKLIMTNEKAETLEEILNQIDDSVFLRYFALQMVKNVSDCWLEHSDYAGIPRLDLNNNEVMEAVLDDVLRVLSASTVDNYDENLITAVRLMCLVEENRMFLEYTDYAAFMKDLEKNKVLQKIDDELQKNPSMATVCASIDNLLMEAIAQEIRDEDKYSYSLRGSLYGDLAESLNKTQGLQNDARVLALSSYAITSFGEFGIYVPNIAVSRVAEYLTDDFKNHKSNITEKDIELFFEKYLQGGN